MKIKAPPSNPFRGILAVLTVFVFLVPVRAGVFTNNFNADPSAAVTLTGVAKWVDTGGVGGSGYISLTDALGGQQGGMVLPEIDPGEAIGGFRADFQIRIGGGTARPADGVAFVFAPEVDDFSNFGEEGMGTGLVLSFDTWDNAGSDTAPAIDVKVGGTANANIVSTTFLGGIRDGNRTRPGPVFTDPVTGAEVQLGTGSEFVPVSIQVKDGLLNVHYKGYQLVKDVVVAFAAVPGRFAFGARTGGAWDNQWIDDLRIETFPRTAPSIVAFSGNAKGFTVQLQDSPNSAVDASSVRATLDGTALTTLATKAADITTFTHTIPGLFASGSTHSVVVTYRHGPPAVDASHTLSFTVNPYVPVPASYAAAPSSVDTTRAGFKARVHQIPVTRTPGDQNSIENAERQLADGYIDPATGTPYPNEADLSQAINGLFELEGIINWSQGAPTAIGNFSELSTPPYTDDLIPGIPGINSGIDNIAAEVITFLELKAGSYRMGVNSDDGFKVTVGPNPRDVFALVLGSFNGGRAAQDSLFDFAIEADGIYPFRLAWWEGVGGANLEWFTVDASGQKIPINDRANPAAVKAYRQGGAGPIYVKAISPSPGSVSVPANAVISITLADAATQVQPSTVGLFVNDQSVAPVVNKPAGSAETRVTYDPPQDFAFEAVIRVRLVFGDTASPSNLRTNEYSFQITPQLLVTIDENTLWKYENNGLDLGTAWKEPNYDDSAWPEGPPLLAFETGATAEPIRTEISRQDPSGNQIVTDYFRTRFVFNGNPGLVKLRLRHVIDDGAVFYLNGVEVHRWGIGAGATFNNTTIFQDQGENTYRGPFDIPAASLVIGTNVFAAELHQSSVGSSDAVFGAELQLLIDTNAPATTIDSIVPAPDATGVPGSAAIVITLLNGTREVVTNSIQLTVNGQPVTPGITRPPGTVATVITYDPPGDFAGESVVAVNLTFSDNTGTVSTRAYSFTIAPTTALLIAINDAVMWRYENTGQDLGTAWKEPNYDDSAWPEGPALLAFELGATAEPIRTQLSRQDPNGNQIVTDYFRTRFVFTGNPGTARLRLRHVLDDGAVFYLNGAEVHRWGIAAGAPFNSTTIFQDQGENTYRGPFDMSSASLLSGTNVLAAELHQSSVGSSDAVFGAELQLITSSPPVSLRFDSIARSGANVEIRWTGAGTLQSADAVTGPWTNVANASSPFTAPNAGNARFYRLVQ